MLFQKELLALQSSPLFTGFFEVEQKRLFNDPIDVKTAFEQKADAEGAKIDEKLDFEKLGLTANSSEADLEKAKTKIFKAAEQTLVDTYKAFRNVDAKVSKYEDLDPRDKGRIDAFLKAAEERRVGLETTAKETTVEVYFNSFMELFRQFDQTALKQANEKGHGMLSGKDNINPQQLGNEFSVLKTAIKTGIAPNLEGITDQNNPMYLEKVWNTATGQFEHLTCARGFKDVKPLTINKTQAFQILDGDGDVLTVFVGKNNQLEVRPGGFVDEKKTQNPQNGFNVFNNIENSKTSRAGAFTALNFSIGKGLTEQAAKHWDLGEKMGDVVKDAQSKKEEIDKNRKSTTDNKEVASQSAVETAFNGLDFSNDEQRKTNLPLLAKNIKKAKDQLGNTIDQKAFDATVLSQFTQKVFQIGEKTINPDKVKEISYGSNTVEIKFKDNLNVKSLEAGNTTTEISIPLVGITLGNKDTGLYLKDSKDKPEQDFSKIKAILENSENDLLKNAQKYVAESKKPATTPNAQPVQAQTPETAKVVSEVQTKLKIAQTNLDTAVRAHTEAITKGQNTTQSWKNLNDAMTAKLLAETTVKKAENRLNTQLNSFNIENIGDKTKLTGFTFNNNPLEFSTNKESYFTNISVGDTKHAGDTPFVTIKIERNSGNPLTLFLDPSLKTVLAYNNGEESKIADGLNDIAASGESLVSTKTTEGGIARPGSVQAETLAPQLAPVDYGKFTGQQLLSKYITEGDGDVSAKQWEALVKNPKNKDLIGEIAYAYENNEKFRSEFNALTRLANTRLTLSLEKNTLKIMQGKTEKTFIFTESSEPKPMQTNGNATEIFIPKSMKTDEQKVNLPDPKTPKNPEPAPIVSENTEPKIKNIKEINAQTNHNDLVDFIKIQDNISATLKILIAKGLIKAGGTKKNATLLFNGNPIMKFTKNKKGEISSEFVPLNVNNQTPNATEPPKPEAAPVTSAPVEAQPVPAQAETSTRTENTDFSKITNIKDFLNQDEATLKKNPQATLQAMLNILEINGSAIQPTEIKKNGYTLMFKFEKPTPTILITNSVMRINNESITFNAGKIPEDKKARIQQLLTKPAKV